MFGSIQPNAYVQGYLCMTHLYLHKNEMLDPLNGALATGSSYMNLPYVDNGLDLINADNGEVFLHREVAEARGARTSSPGRAKGEDRGEHGRGAVPPPPAERRDGNTSPGSQEHQQAFRRHPGPLGHLPFLSSPGPFTPWWVRTARESQR